MTTRRNEETDLYSGVKAVFESVGCKLWRNNNGAVRAHGRMIRFGLTPGAADFIGLWSPSGRFVSVEVKTARGRKDHPERFAAQDEWAWAVRVAGGFACQVASVEEALSAALELSGRQTSMDIAQGDR